MTHILLPEIWLIVLIVGLPQLSETVYTPSLPDIARALGTNEVMVEYTLTIYLFGFAFGTLFWGTISDKLGRKPCIIAGLLVFVIGCIGCYFSNSIEMLMISRLIQAFGGSTGSVLGNAICRDVFHGPALGKVYSTTSSALAFFPALGPLCGGFIAEIFGWRGIFIFLIVSALIVTIFTSKRLPETRPYTIGKKFSILSVAKQLILDKKVVGFGLIVGGCNGILFSYFAEGSFYLINSLGLSPSYYGLSFIAIGGSAMFSAMISKKLQNKYSCKKIIDYGLWIIVFATGIFSCVSVINHNLFAVPSNVMIAITIILQSICIFGTCMASVNSLVPALIDYKHAIGTASSLFGFFYYCLISLFTFFMGLVHDGTLLPMPLYFLSLSCFMMLVNSICLRS